MMVAEYMTKDPHTVAGSLPISKAKELMTKLDVRHLPVLEGGKLLGVITDRDIRTIEGIKGIEIENVKIEEACSNDPYTAKEDATVEEVATIMIDHKISSVLVVSGDKVKGIFTWIDALKILKSSLFI